MKVKEDEDEDDCESANESDNDAKKKRRDEINDLVRKMRFNLEKFGLSQSSICLSWGCKMQHAGNVFAKHLNPCSTKDPIVDARKESQCEELDLCIQSCCLAQNIHNHCHLMNQLQCFV